MKHMIQIRQKGSSHETIFPYSKSIVILSTLGVCTTFPRMKKVQIVQKSSTILYDPHLNLGRKSSGHYPAVGSLFIFGWGRTLKQTFTKPLLHCSNICQKVLTNSKGKNYSLIFTLLCLEKLQTNFSSDLKKGKKRYI